MTTINQNTIDAKLWTLHDACKKYQATDRLAMLVLYAISDYINTGKAPRPFVCQFVEYPDSKLDSLIKDCLSGNRSANGIVSTCKKAFARNQ